MHNRGFPTTVFNHHMRSDSNRVESFPPPLIFSPTDTDFNSNPSPISPLLRYSVKTPPPAIGKAYYQDMIWKTQGSSFGAVGSGEGSIMKYRPRSGPSVIRNCAATIVARPQFGGTVQSSLTFKRVDSVMVSKIGVAFETGSKGGRAS